MSLFDDNDKVGLAMIILAVVTFVMAIVGVVLVFTNDGDKLPGILSAIGCALAGVIYFGFGKKLRNNEFTGKMNILVAFIKVTALVTLINGIFSIPSWVKCSCVHHHRSSPVLVHDEDDGRSDHCQRQRNLGRSSRPLHTRTHLIDHIHPWNHHDTFGDLRNHHLRIHDQTPLGPRGQGRNGNVNLLNRLSRVGHRPGLMVRGGGPCVFLSEICDQYKTAQLKQELVHTDVAKPNPNRTSDNDN